MGCSVNLVDGAVGGLFAGFSSEAVRAWAQLAAAVDERGPVPCVADPETWWVTPASPRVEEALYGCSRCPVEALCLAYAVAAGEREGVWGGVVLGARGRRSVA